MKLLHEHVHKGKGFSAALRALTPTGTRWGYDVGLTINIGTGDNPETDYYAVVDKRNGAVTGDVGQARVLDAGDGAQQNIATGGPVPTASVRRLPVPARPASPAPTATER